MSKDAQGEKSQIILQIADEEFTAQGIQISEKNYLEVYHYDKWAEQELPKLQEGDKIKPSSITVNQGSTTPPSHLSEADLISLMDKHGIGTDATIHEHIKNI